MTETHRYGRQRLAWAILFGSFFACLLFGVSTPLAVRAFLRNATQPLDIMVQANQGTVGIEEASGPRRAVLVGEPPQAVQTEATVRTDTTASALMMFLAPDAVDPLAQMQVAGNTTLTLSQALAPRFDVSGRPHQLQMDLRGGRVRVDVPPFESRPLVLTLTTPQGSVEVDEPGRYTFEVSNDVTQVNVQETGTATVLSEGEALTLAAGQRAEIQAGASLLGPLDPARNLVQNSDFSHGLDNWASFAWQVELPDQPKGETVVRDVGGDPLLRFTREGIGHADVRVTQSINQDVSGYDEVRLQATLSVLNQSLGVCGVQGSECPLFIVVNYIDESGVARVWQHGFFAEGVVDDNLTPGACISCAVVQRPHDRVPLDQLYFYEVDLRQELASQGFLPPRFIENISLVGSGHSFTTEVSDVALVVE